MGHFYDFPLARTLTMTRLVRPLAVLLSLVGLSAAGWTAAPPARAQTSMFSTQEVDQGKFIIVAAPIGDGSRGQLNIYEQRSAQRPCYAVSGSRPAVVDPLLATFDFTGICNRFIDGNGYSLRIGTADLGTVYRLSVVKDSAETLLMAQPTRPDAGPEMVVARTGGQGNGFLLLVADPGWRVMRRSFGSRALGHVYVYRDSWPEGGTASRPSPEPAAPAAKLPLDPKAPAEQKAGSPPQAPDQGAAQKPGLGASVPVPNSVNPKPVAVAKPIAPANPVQSTKAVQATKAVAATGAAGAVKAGVPTKAAEPSKRPRPVAAASTPRAAAPLAGAPNLPALPAAAPVPVAP